MHIDNPLYLSENQIPTTQNQKQENPEYLSSQNYASKAPGINGQGPNGPNFNNLWMSPQFTNQNMGQGAYNNGMDTRFNNQPTGNIFYKKGMNFGFNNQPIGNIAYNQGMGHNFINQPIGNGAYNQGSNNNFGGMNFQNINQIPPQNKMNEQYRKNQGLIFNNQRVNNFPNNYNINDMNNYYDNRQYNKIQFPVQNQY